MASPQLVPAEKLLTIRRKTILLIVVRLRSLVKLPTMKNQTLCGRNYFSNRFLRTTIAIFAIFQINFFQASAQGDLMIYPKRILFEGAKRSQEINLANSGKDTARYILSVIQIRMKEDGSFEQINEADPGQKFADKYFRIFPRNVVLGPNEAQTVKVQLINTSAMEPGEYRSHLYIRAEEEKKPLGENDTPADPKAINVKLVAVFGVSIPVIIRTGENTSTVSLTGLSLKQPVDSIPYVEFNFKRTGNMSVYGDINVDYVSAEGKATRIGSANGIAVYTPTETRHFNLALTPPSNFVIGKGKLRVSYQYDGKDDKAAEQVIELN
jgi:hypothetical protein